MVSYNRFSIAAAVLPLLLSCCSAQVNFMTEPSPRWSIQLRNSGPSTGRGMRKGNAITAHKNAGKIVATANDGSLHIIQTSATNVTILAVFEPEAKSGATTECVSGATIVHKDEQEGLFVPVETEVVDEKDNKDKQKDQEEVPVVVPTTEDFIVYAVVDKKGATATSRVIAVDMEGTEKWTFSYAGKIEGSPVVGKSGIYVTTNYEGMGVLSVLRMSPEDGSVVLAATAGAYAELGAPTLKQTATEAQQNGPQNDNVEESGDVVIVAENWDSGFSETVGGLYMLSGDLLFGEIDDKAKDQTTLETETSGRFEYILPKISTLAYSASALPVVYGDSIYMGAAGANVAGFTGDVKNDLSGIEEGEDEIVPRWEVQLAQNPLDASQPLQTQPVMGNSGNYVCLAGVDNDFSCLLSNSGREVWRNEETSQILAQPIIFRGERRNVVYAIETERGRVHSYDLFSGRKYWDYSCSDTPWDDLCTDPVEADFAITSSGNTIFYGDVNGRITSLAVAIFDTEAPTIAPTGTPTATPTGNPTSTRYPTQMPVNATIVAPGKPGLEDEIQLGGSSDTVASAQQAEQGMFDKTTTIYIGAAAAGLCAALIPIVLFAMIRKRKKKRKKMEKEAVVEIVEDFSSDGSTDDLEAQAQAFFESIETSNIYDPDNGGGIEVELMDHTTPSKKKKKKNLPDTPDTVDDSVYSVKEISDDTSAMVVLGRQFDATDQSVEAVNLRQTFDCQVSEKDTDGGDSDDEVPPPPPIDTEAPVSPLSPASPSSRSWTWGISPASQKAKKSSQTKLKKAEKSELEQPALTHSASQADDKSVADKSLADKSLADKSLASAATAKKGSVAPKKKRIWKRKNKKDLPPKPEPEPEPEPEPQPDAEEDPPSLTLKPEKESVEDEEPETPVLANETDEAESSDDEEVNEDATSEEDFNDEGNEEVKKSDTVNKMLAGLQTPASPAPSAYSMASESLERKTPSQSAQSTPVKSVQSIQESLFGTNTPSNQSMARSVTSDDSSLYTSYTLTAGIAAMFVGAAEEPEKKELSPYSSYVYDQDIRRRDRDEIVNEGNSFLVQPSLSDAEGPDDEEFGLKPRNHRGSARAQAFLSKNAESEGGTATISQMYDQLAAIGQQRREEKKPAFRRRNKRPENPTPPPPAPQQQEKQGGDTWGSFLNELAEAEKSFFSPAESKSKSLLNDSSEDVGELPPL
mmetsp:Transcript_19352/g.48187  ORF Transcript_19352/g.48187 Transcript_19352/m.48187 type:complete len:1201 (-) Transcript_19352:2687-6289(-)